MITDSQGRVLWVVAALALLPGGCRLSSETGPTTGDELPSLTAVSADRITGEAFGGFGTVRAVVPLSGDRIAVADGNDRVVRILARDGTLLQRFGRRGQGPGEFEQLSDLWSSSNDILVARDGRLLRLQMGHPTTGFTTAWSSTAVGDTAPYTSPVGITRDGIVVLQSLMPTRPSDPPIVERSAQRLLLSRAGRTLSVITGLHGAEVYRGRGYALGQIAFSRITLYSVTDDEIYALDSAGDTVVVYGVDGTQRRRFSVHLPRRPVRQEDRDADRDRRRKLAQQFVGVGLPEAFVQGRLDAVDEIPSADSMPTASALHVDEAGRLWIRRFRPVAEEEAEGQLWIVFEGDGTLIGRFRLPGTLSASRPSRGVVWTWGQDSIGVPFVQPWRVEEIGRAAGRGGPR